MFRSRFIAILFIFCQLFLTAVTSVACPFGSGVDAPAIVESERGDSDCFGCDSGAGPGIAEIRARAFVCEAPLSILERIDVLLGHADMVVVSRADHTPEFLATFLRGTFLRHSVFLI